MSQDQRSTSDQMRTVVHSLDEQGLAVAAAHIRQRLPIVGPPCGGSATIRAVVSLGLVDSSLRNQLWEAVKTANRLGCYDAADLLVQWWRGIP